MPDQQGGEDVCRHDARGAELRVGVVDRLLARGQVDDADSDRAVMGAQHHAHRGRQQCVEPRRGRPDRRGVTGS